MNNVKCNRRTYGLEFMESRMTDKRVTYNPWINK